MRIEAAPLDAMYDEPISMRIAGLPPSRAVAVSAEARDGAAHRWSSHATFVADPDGAIDMARVSPAAGSWHLADASGLLWSMQLDPAVVERHAFTVQRPDPVVVNLRAEVDGQPAATATLVRRFMRAGIERHEIREDGMVATLFHPGNAPRPGVILLGGSGGGLAEDHPALLASHGYAVLSLAYFAMAGLPQGLIEIPLEYFERAIAWMKRSAAVRSGPLAVIGSSRGGELALLLGATFPEIRAVIAYVPSGIVWPGIGSANQGFASSWTWRGKPVAFIEPAPPDLGAWSRPPVRLTPWFLESMKNRESAARAAIAVEKIRGPVLMFSGTDDQMWPSLNLADAAMQRLLAQDFPHSHEHISYAGAGHFIRFPYSPVISEIFHPVVKTPMALGGAPEANHLANLDSWRRCLALLASELG
jgi:dienelactone hydrolase